MVDFQLTQLLTVAQGEKRGVVVYSHLQRQVETL